MRRRIVFALLIVCLVAASVCGAYLPEHRLTMQAVMQLEAVYGLVALGEMMRESLRRRPAASQWLRELFWGWMSEVTPRIRSPSVLRGKTAALL